MHCGYRSRFDRKRLSEQKCEDVRDDDSAARERCDCGSVLAERRIHGHAPSGLGARAVVGGLAGLGVGLGGLTCSKLGGDALGHDPLDFGIRVAGRLRRLGRTEP